MRRLNDPNSAVHGVVTTAAVAGLALVEPRKLSTGRRLVYRGAVAALSAWTLWAGLRPSRDSDLDLLGPVGRAGVAAGAGGAALGFADAGEAIDARLHDGMARAGARRPRVWLAAGEAALSIAAWWVSRVADRAATGDADDSEGPDQMLVDVPEALRAVVSRMLAETEDYGALQLREQFEASKLISFDAGEVEVEFAQFEVPEDLARAVPGNGTFPVIARFRAFDDRTFDIRLFVEDGHLDAVSIDEGADWTDEDRDAWNEADHDLSELDTWPSPDEIDILIETSSGYRQVST